MAMTMTMAAADARRIKLEVINKNLVSQANHEVHCIVLLMCSSTSNIGGIALYATKISAMARTQ